MQRILVLLFIWLPSASAMAQFTVDTQEGQSYYEDNFLRYENHVYKPGVKTVLLYPKGWPLGPPVINLNDERALELRFDILDTTLDNLMYTLVHCDRQWQPSDLQIQEYVDGMPEDYLSEYTYSRNTFQRYVHYRLEIPSESMHITRSGNYLVQVYRSGNPDDLILTRRFSVAENIVTVKASIHQPTRVKERNSHQEIDFSIELGNYDLTNPYSDLHVVVMQNHSWENALTGLQPRFVKDRVLDYDYDFGNAFPALNEWRLFDIKNTRFTGTGIAKVSFNNKENHAYKVLDLSRASRVYSQNRDINGWYFVKNDWLNTEGHVDADYVYVHFKLSQDKALETGDIYVYGALTDWKLKPEAKMKFNQLELQYEQTLHVKQGLYNYLYAFSQDGNVAPDLTRFEGSHFQCENEYAIYVFHRQMGWDYDRLISYTVWKFPN